ncbi:Uncharacterised protein [uncultured archaeon]|nr:Uncharacterised protein [uncultured archaeon]
MARIPSKRLQGAALKLLRQNLRLKRGERVALVTDRKDCMVFVALDAAARQLGASVSEAYLDPDRQNSAPVPAVGKLFMESDVIIAPTSKSITHSPETIAARKKAGARVASMPGITEKMLIQAMSVDPRRIRTLHSRLRRHLQGANTVYVTTPSGTRLVVRMNDHQFAFNDGGDIIRKGTVCNVPFGEVYAMIDDGNGAIAIDSWNRMISTADKAVLHITDGKITRWSKGALPYVRNQRKAGPCGSMIVELGIGTNPAHKKPIGIVLHDEKIFGSVHVAFGGGGNIRKCAVHEDVILLRPTVMADGKVIIRDGKFV